MDLLLGTLCIGLVGGLVLAVFFVSSAGKKQKQKQADAPAILDALFDGSPVVTYSSGFASLTAAEVIKGALERGYELVSQGAANSYGMQDLVFKKAD